MRLIRILALGLFFLMTSCRGYDQSVQKPESSLESPASDSTAKTSSTSSKPIYLPSQQPQGYKMPADRPNEVCMEKGWTWLYKGFLTQQCAGCHVIGNKFGVSAFAQLNAEAESFAVMKGVDKTAFLGMALKNSFCGSCTIKETDPLYKDLQYFTDHMSSCEKP